MENALLYTFSTIAQALGGMFALLAAFVLYRFQSLGSMMDGDAKLLEDVYTGRGTEQDRHHELRGQGRYREVYDNIEALVATFPAGTRQRYGSHGKAPFDRLRRAVEIRENLQKWFILAAWLTGLTMIGSVALIPLAQVLRWRYVVAVIVLAGGVLAFAGCIWVYWRLIRAALSLVAAAHGEH
jgi:hypothetical protein